MESAPFWKTMDTSPLKYIFTLIKTFNKGCVMKMWQRIQHKGIKEVPSFNNTSICLEVSLLPFRECRGLTMYLAVNLRELKYCYLCSWQHGWQKFHLLVQVSKSLTGNFITSRKYCRLLTLWLPSPRPCQTHGS